MFKPKETQFYNYCLSSDYERGYYNAASMYIKKEIQYNKNNALLEIEDTFTYLKYKVSEDGIVSKLVRPCSNFVLSLGFLDTKEDLDNNISLMKDILDYFLNVDSYEVIDNTLSLLESWDIQALYTIIKDKDFKCDWLNSYRDSILSDILGVKNT